MDACRPFRVFGLIPRPNGQISKYLYLLDLILLARANKFFRSMLMSRSAIQTWQHALSNVPGLPPCPKELCEPQYAALVFSKHCSVSLFLLSNHGFGIDVIDSYLHVPTNHAKMIIVME